MIGEGIVKCKCGASANAQSRTGWIWDWKTGWQCPEHSEASKAFYASTQARSKARHPSNGEAGE